MNKLSFKFAYPMMGEHGNLKLHMVEIREVGNVTTPRGEVGGTAVLGTLVMDSPETENGIARLSNAVAVCSPKDEYSFEKGCKKVVERLLDNIRSHNKPPKEYRTAMWTSYFDAIATYRSQV